MEVSRVIHTRSEVCGGVRRIAFCCCETPNWLHHAWCQRCFITFIAIENTKNRFLFCFWWHYVLLKRWCYDVPVLLTLKTMNDHTVTFTYRPSLLLFWNDLLYSAHSIFYRILNIFKHIHSYTYSSTMEQSPIRGDKKEKLTVDSNDLFWFLKIQNN